MTLNKDFEKIGYDIIGSAYAVRKEAGRGLREKYYEQALAWEISQKGYSVKTQVSLPALYKGIEIGDSFLADVVVEGRVIIEVKALRYITESEIRQLNTYLKLADFRLGYLINFGVEDFSTKKFNGEYPLSGGIYRLVNDIDKKGSL